MDADARSSRIAEAVIPQLVGNAAKGGEVAMTSDSRAMILEQVRKATGTSASSAELQSSDAGIDRDYIRSGKLGATERVALMIERLREYDADVVQTGPHDLTMAIAAQLKASARHCFVVPEGVPEAWMSGGYEFRIDRNL